MIIKPATLTSDTGAPVVLRSVKARGRLSGLLLTMTLHQTFRNDETRHIEVTYTFPLPWGAVLTGLEATLGETRVRGEVMARQRAAQRYEDAVEDGDAPVMVEKNPEGSFTASLGSLKPGEEATVELSYAQVLGFDHGRVRLVVPTTIAPRYGDAVTDGGLLPQHAVQPNLLAEHAFGLELTLAGPLAQAQVSCPSHHVASQTVGGEVRVATVGDAWLDRDFVLLMEGLEGQSLAVAGPDPASGEGHCALIASFCPQRAGLPEAALSLKILVDCSGSMTGDSMQQARTALTALAAGLKTEDRFNYSRFGSEPRLVVSARHASAWGRWKLVAAIKATKADLGGTEMGAAFDHVFDLRLPPAQGSPEADVLVITDGAVWNVQDILARARRSGHRIYALGVGSAPAESLLSELAQDTGGACEFVTPNDDMVAAMQRLLKRMRTAAVAEVTLDVEPRPLWCTPLPRRVADDETVHIHLRLPARPGTTPRLRCDGHDETPTEVTWLSDDLVARIVAARQISHTADQADAALIAERYQLVTEHTNLLLVFQRAEAERTDGMPALRQVPPMVAAGAGGVGSVRNAPSSGMAYRVSRSAGRFSDLSAFDRLNIVGAVSYPVHTQSSADHGGETREATPTGALLARRVTAFEIVRAFNDAVQPGLSFRQVLRSVTERSLDPRIAEAVEAAVEVAGSRIKGWACFLMWLHELDAPGARLSDAALALVTAQVQRVDARQQRTIAPLFEEATA